VRSLTVAKVDSVGIRNWRRFTRRTETGIGNILRGISMTRKKLKAINGDRMRFSGTFDDFGIKKGYSWETTVILKNIMDEYNKHRADHLWFNYTKGLQALDLSGGERIEFDARVKSYKRANSSVDYKLKYNKKQNY
jgi:hypothetical protein